MRELGGKALTQNQTLDAAAAHPRLSILVNGRISTSLSRPDMSLPPLVRLLSAKLRREGRMSDRAGVKGH